MVFNYFMEFLIIVLGFLVLTVLQKLIHPIKLKKYVYLVGTTG